MTHKKKLQSNTDQKLPTIPMREIDRIVGYCWDDEEADFAEHVEDGDAHIFRDLQVVNYWVKAVKALRKGRRTK